MRRAPLLLLLPLLVSGLSSCGDDAADAGSEAADEQTTPSSVEQEPRCEDVWVDGEKLPENYRGCSEGETWVKADIRRCESGQILVTYGDRFYGAKGFVVNDVGEPLTESKQYQRALHSCG